MLKFKLSTAAVLAALICFLGGTAVVRRQDARLNRTLRSVALRVIQVETLSRTRRQVYRLEFWNNRCLVEYYDQESGRWLRERDIPFPKGVMTPAAGTRLFFSGGRLERFEGEVKRGRKSPYLLLEFRIPGTSKSRSMIFFQDGNWRILS